MASRCYRYALRPLTTSDVKFVMSIEIDSFPDPWSPMAFICDIENNPRSRYFAAVREDGTICGYIGYWIVPFGIDVLRLAVCEEDRHCGIGQALLRVATGSSNAKEGYTRVFVRHSNESARRFYEACGFAQAGEHEGYYSAPNENAAIYVLPGHAVQP